MRTWLAQRRKVIASAIGTLAASAASQDWRTFAVGVVTTVVLYIVPNKPLQPAASDGASSPS